VPEASSAGACSSFGTANFLIVILGRDSEGKGRAGISDKTADGEAFKSGRKALGDRKFPAAGTGVAV
jgi:hypothetical protein